MEFGRQKRWEKNIKIDLRDINYRMGWIELVIKVEYSLGAPNII